MGMRGIYAISVIASIFFIGAIGLSQDVWAATVFVKDEFGVPHEVDESEFEIASPDSCSFMHYHAANYVSVTAPDGAVIFDPAPFVCGYGISADDLSGTLTDPRDAAVVPSFFRFTMDVTDGITDGTESMQVPFFNGLAFHTPATEPVPPLTNARALVLQVDAEENPDGIIDYHLTIFPGSDNGRLNTNALNQEGRVTLRQEFTLTEEYNADNFSLLVGVNDESQLIDPSGIIVDISGTGLSGNPLIVDLQFPYTALQNPFPFDIESIETSFTLTPTVVEPPPITKQLNLGIVQWDKDSHSVPGTAIVTISDPDLNQDPDSIEMFQINVNSDSDPNGISLTVVESGLDTGIFEGVLELSTGDSGEYNLKVKPGDTVTATYDDDTVPPDTPEKDSNIIATTQIEQPSKIDLAITKEIIDPPQGNIFAPGDTIKFKMTATNNGNIDEERVRVFDTLETSQGTLIESSLMAPAKTECRFSDIGQMRCDVPGIPAGESIMISLNVKINSEFEGVLVNMADVTHLSIGGAAFNKKEEVTLQNNHFKLNVNVAGFDKRLQLIYDRAQEIIEESGEVSSEDIPVPLDHELVERTNVLIDEINPTIEVIEEKQKGLWQKYDPLSKELPTVLSKYGEESQNYKDLEKVINEIKDEYVGLDASLDSVYDTLEKLCEAIERISPGVTKLIDPNTVFHRVYIMGAPYSQSDIDEWNKDYNRIKGIFEEHADQDRDPVNPFVNPTVGNTPTELSTRVLPSIEGVSIVTSTAPTLKVT